MFKAQISAVSGRIIEQKVEFKGKEDVKIDDKIYKTLRFNFSFQTQVCQRIKNLILIFGTKRVLFFGLKQLLTRQVTGNTG